MKFEMRKYFKKSSTDTYAFLFLTSMIVITFIFQIFIVQPFIYELNSIKLILSIIFSTFVLHNVVGNLYLIITTDTSIRKYLLPSINLPPLWHYCLVCECNCPPRSHHCNECNLCLLKRDHHCIFTMCCIGYYNQRYFVCLLLYVSIGCFYSFIMNMQFIWYQFDDGLTLYNLIAHTFPFIFWLFSSTLTTKQTIYSIISVINICGFLFAFTMLFYHTNLLLSNQTTYERNHNDNKYNLFNWKLNLIESLGTNWYIIWLSPFIKLKLPRNGLHYPTYKEYMNTIKKGR